MGVSILRSHSITRIVVVGLLVLVGTSAVMSQQSPPRSPSDTVREFYKAMHEKRFREAFAMSIYKPAVEPLKPQELKICDQTLKEWQQ